MPIGFLSTADPERLNPFPAQIAAEDLYACFRLSEAALRTIHPQREAHTRLGFARQLCALRYWGFAPDDFQTPPWEAVVYVARPLALPPEALQAYGQRSKTRTTHLQQVQGHLGFRPAIPLEFYALQTWLEERPLEHDTPTLLLQLACDKLRRKQIVANFAYPPEKVYSTAPEGRCLRTT
jgi:Domain of unknown function (DUF4158)